MNSLLEEVFFKCLGSKEKLMQYIAQDIDLAQYIKAKYGNYILLGLAFLANRQDILNELKKRSLEIVKKFDQIEIAKKYINYFQEVSKSRKYFLY